MYFDCKIEQYPGRLFLSIGSGAEFTAEREYRMSIDVESCYRKYGPMVLRRCRSLLKDEEQALDSMREVFVKLLENSGRLTADYPSSLLFTMATNICLNRIRYDKRRYGASDELLQAIAVYDDTHERLALGETLDSIFGKEPPSTREMAVMHYVDGLTLQEVSMAVGLSVSGVRKRLRTLKEKVALLREADNEII
jgi:RNA polymerase sigma-70 factor (ECF subfamily)